jgi:hypothetical protein
VINRRASSSLSSALVSEPETLKAHQQELCPRRAARFVALVPESVLVGKGSLRRAKHRRALVSSARFRLKTDCDGRLRREQMTSELSQQKESPSLLLTEQKRATSEVNCQRFVKLLTGRSISEVDLQPELQLPRVECRSEREWRGRTARAPNQRVRQLFQRNRTDGVVDALKISAVEKIEAFRGEFHVSSAFIAEWEPARKPQVDAKVARAFPDISSGTERTVCGWMIVAEIIEPC